MLLSCLGSSLEWFDFALYNYLGGVFSKIFFPHTPQYKWLATIATYAIFFIGFSARPIGGLIFGYLGDKYGRLFSLRLTPLLITVTTIAIACLPTYQSVGGFAIFFLVLTRLMQGILIGGEFAGNIVYLCESSTRWNYFLGSIGSCTGSLGIILASLVATIFYSTLSQATLLSYGWRIAFLISIPFGIIVFITRLKMKESRDFQYKTLKYNPIATVIESCKKKILVCLGLIYMHATSFYFVFVFLPVFLVKYRHLVESAALLKNTSFLVLHLLLIPFFGVIVNLLGGIRSLIFIALFFSITSIPVFYLIAYGSINAVLISLFIFSITTAFNAAVIPGLLSRILPSEIRYTALAFVFNRPSAKLNTGRAYARL